jgi:chemotaxis signal transduction protein
MQTGSTVINLGDVMFGIEMRYITEIIGMQQITVLPDMRHL